MRLWSPHVALLDHFGLYIITVGVGAHGWIASAAFELRHHGVFGHTLILRLAYC
jgi:hypothetical protein